MRIAYILEQMTGGWLGYELDALCDLWAEIMIHPVNPAVYGSFEGDARYRKRTLIGDLGRAAVTTLAHPAATPVLFRKLSSAAGKKIALAALSTSYRVGRERPVIMHAHFATAPAASAWAVSRLTGIPYGFTAHGGYDLTKGPIDRDFLTVKCRDAAFVRCVSDYGRRRLISMTGIDDARFRVIHCGVDTRYFAPRESPEKRTRKEKTILTVAGLVEPKGIIYLLHALADTSLKESGVRSIIVGDGPLRRELQEAARRLGAPAVFVGPVGSDEVRRYYHEADLFVLPCVTGQDGHHDGVPVALMEAMACGVPVISTRLSGIPELVEDNKSGTLVAEKDPRELAAAVKRLLTDADARRRFSMEGRKKVVTQFEIRDVARRLMELLWACSKGRGDGQDGR
jgi:glycosyltransferase involved in cell wall biosynthesis